MLVNQKGRKKETTNVAMQHTRRKSVEKTLLMRALTRCALADESHRSPASRFSLKETTETVYCKCDNIHTCVYAGANAYILLYGKWLHLTWRFWGWEFDVHVLLNLSRKTLSTRCTVHKVHTDALVYSITQKKKKKTTDTPNRKCTKFDLSLYFHWFRGWIHSLAV